MGLRLGSNLTVPELAGRWNVWSQADECPGAYFVVPGDAVAREQGITYAIIRAVQPRAAAHVNITLVRTVKKPA